MYIFKIASKFIQNQHNKTMPKNNKTDFTQKRKKKTMMLHSLSLALVVSVGALVETPQVLLNAP